MADMKAEVRTSVQKMFTYLSQISQKQPTATIEADEFNSVLARAEKAFPNLKSIQEMREFSEGDRALVTSMALRLSNLSGILVADHVQDLNSEPPPRVRDWTDQR